MEIREKVFLNLARIHFFLAFCVGSDKVETMFIGPGSEMPMNQIFMRTICCFSILCFLFCSAALAEEDKITKSVLYLNSYHDGYQWSDSIREGIRSGLGSSNFQIDLQIEYMDAKKHNTASVLANLLLLYQQKFKDETFDVVIVSDDDAFNFALKYRPVLFPGVPLVFCGVNDLSEDDLSVGNSTGIVESFDLLGTVDVALRLHPEIKQMIVVGDNSTAGQAIRKQIEELVPLIQERLSVEYWVDRALVNVQEDVRNLSTDSFLFFIPYYQVIDKYFYNAEEVMSAISASSNVPIYTGWEFLLGHGAVGGSLLSGMKHGESAAAMAVKILSGVQAEDIAVQYEPQGVYLFDYLVMKRMGINQKLLPPGSRIINAPNHFYELPREIFWTIIVSFMILVVILIFLMSNMVARRKIERKIKNQLTFQETLIDTIPQLVSWKDIQGRYVGANQTFAHFFGLEALSEVVSKTTKDVVADQQYVKWSIEADAAVVKKQQALRKVRKEIFSGDGESSWLELNKVPLRDQDGRVTGILTTAENVTREQNLEKQLLQSQKMEAIGTLAGGIAHDFNNILTSIINSTELAISDVASGSQTKKDLERVLKAAHRGGRVVKQILTFSRPSQEGFKSTDLGAVVTEVITLMEVSLPANIRMKSYIMPGMSEILADPTQIHQALMNLCTNSFHELRETGGEIQLRLEDVQLDTESAGYLDLDVGSCIKITVIDDGPGIEPKILDKIFDPFFSSKDKTEGSGLGLTVVLGIVKGHGGVLRVQSEVGKGARFEMYLPKIVPLPDSQTREVSSGAQRGGTILFVEDDEDQLLTAPRILKTFGYEVDAVGDSHKAAALLMAASDTYDLLITDYDMPGLSGIELARLVEQQVPELPVIMISGREEAVNAVSEITSVRKIFLKPYDKNELVTMISSILQGT